jgi:hypothetical protein
VISDQWGEGLARIHLRSTVLPFFHCALASWRFRMNRLKTTNNTNFHESEFRNASFAVAARYLVRGRLSGSCPGAASNYSCPFVPFVVPTRKRTGTAKPRRTRRKNEGLPGFRCGSGKEKGKRRKWGERRERGAGSSTIHDSPSPAWRLGVLAVEHESVGNHELPEWARMNEPGNRGAAALHS